MTTRARTFASIHIYPAYTGIGPGFRSELAVFHLDNAAVTGKAARGSFEIAVHSLVEPWIDRPNDLDGIGVLAMTVLLGLIRMATGAFLGRDNRRDGHFVFGTPKTPVGPLILFVMIAAHVRVELLGLVTIEACNVGAGMSAGGPVGK